MEALVFDLALLYQPVKVFLSVRSQAPVQESPLMSGCSQ